MTTMNTDNDNNEQRLPSQDMLHGQRCIQSEAQTNDTDMLGPCHHENEALLLHATVTMTMTAINKETMTMTTAMTMITLLFEVV